MRIKYSTRRAVLDTIDGQPNPFKQIILDMQEFRAQCTPLDTGDVNYQGFDIPEAVWIAYMDLTGEDYWTMIFQIAYACVYSNYPESKLSRIFIAMKVKNEMLSEDVAAGMPERTYEEITFDSEGEEVSRETKTRTWGSWYQNPAGSGIYDLGDGYSVLLCNVQGKYLTDQELLVLKGFSDAHPEHEITFLNRTEFINEIQPLHTT